MCVFWNWLMYAPILATKLYVPPDSSRPMVNDLNIRTGTQPVPSRSAAAAVNPAHLILNPASGSTALLLRKLARVARERGIRVRVLGTGEDAGRAALAAADDGAQSLAVAGGDGSVAAVAAERGLPLAVVPTGTLNHFARDLGLDLAPARCAPSTRSTQATSGSQRAGQRTPVHQQRLARDLHADAE